MGSTKSRINSQNEQKQPGKHHHHFFPDTYAHMLYVRWTIRYSYQQIQTENLCKLPDTKTTIQDKNKINRKQGLECIKKIEK